MEPTISFHGIGNVSLTPSRYYRQEDGREFWVRDLVVTDEQGNTFRLGLYSNSAFGLLLPGEPYNQPLDVGQLADQGIPAPF